MEAIRHYVKGAFQGVEETPQVLEQQDELIADVTAKVDDLVSQGKTPDEALGMAIASLGGLSALVEEFRAEQDSLDSITEAPLVRTAAVYSGRLDFHTDAICFGVFMTVMLLCTVVGGNFTNTIEGYAGPVLLLALLAAISWLRYAYVRSAPHWNEIEAKELVYRWRLLKSIGVAAAIATGAVWASMFTGAPEFWFWPLWVVAVAFPIRVLVGWFVIRRGWFLAPATAAIEVD